MLRTRRPLLALLLLVLLLAGGYLLSALGSDSETDGAAGSGPTASGAASVAASPTTRPGSPTVRSGSPTARPSRTPAGGLPSVRPADLPAEARRTLQLIDRGGPFPYERDGVVFGNNERLLPAHPRGWYREYTVPTPGERDRGARRLVVGRDGARYYTADHYDSFAVVAADP